MNTRKLSESIQYFIDKDLEMRQKWLDEIIKISKEPFLHSNIGSKLHELTKELLLIDSSLKALREVKIGAWAFESRTHEMLKALQEALKEAKITIYAHHGEHGWDSYQNSPEMKKINEAIKKATE